MDLEEIKQKMFDKLILNGWDKVLKSFIFSTEFDDILTKLYTLSQEDKRFTPPLKQLFRAFEECHYDKLKVVMQSHGKNLNLIRLYTNEGAGDIEIISYILAERENNPPLFKNDYNLVTKDVAAIKVAKSYGITCLDYIPSKDTK